ncbi:sorting nexin [Chamberlinius hualienensis]
MAGEGSLTSFHGRSVPLIYQEIYSILCPTSECIVDKNVFLRFMTYATSLSENVLLNDYNEQELPIPILKDLEILQGFGKRMWREQNPSLLNLSYAELVTADVSTVELVPEKKGIILKHVEYVVTSQKYRSKVNRRYNDFLAFYETLLLKYPYRMVPRLPPKKMMGANAKFIEQRRKALNRFLTLIVRHPVLGIDRIVTFFLTYDGPDPLVKLKSDFRNIPDEFLLSDISSKSDLVPQNGRVHLATSREQIHFIHTSLVHVEEIVARMVARSQEYTTDLNNLQKEISSLANEPRVTSSWATGGCETWDHIKKGCLALSPALGQISVRTKCQNYLQEDEIVDHLNLLLDLLASYKDLCDRHEKGTMAEHQKVMTRVISIRKKVQQVSAQGNNNSSSDVINSHIAEQENHIQAMEKRSQFALHCLHLETQLIHVSLEILVTLFKSMAEVFSFSYAEMSRMWDSIRPIVGHILPEKVNSVLSSSNGN